MPFHSCLIATQNDPTKNKRRDILKVGDWLSSALRACCVLRASAPPPDFWLRAGKGLAWSSWAFFHFLLLFEPLSIADSSIRNTRFEIYLSHLLAGGSWTNSLTSYPSISMSIKWKYKPCQTNTGFWALNEIIHVEQF